MTLIRVRAVRRGFSSEYTGDLGRLGPTGLAYGGLVDDAMPITRRDHVTCGRLREPGEEFDCPADLVADDPSWGWMTPATAADQEALTAWRLARASERQAARLRAAHEEAERLIRAAEEDE
jgi:hypothetical protein